MIILAFDKPFTILLSHISKPLLLSHISTYLWGLPTGISAGTTPALAVDRFPIGKEWAKPVALTRSRRALPNSGLPHLQFRWYL